MDRLVIDNRKTDYQVSTAIDLIKNLMFQRKILTIFNYNILSTKRQICIHT